MNQQLARDVLQVVIKGNLVSGLIVYGLRKRHAPMRPVFPSDVWWNSMPSEYVLHGEAWEVIMWQIPVRVWPPRAELETALRLTMANLISAECRVAWVSSEGGMFCDGPALFDPECMSGGVLAWLTDAGTASIVLDPNLPLDPVSDSVMLELRSHAAGLADVA